MPDLNRLPALSDFERLALIESLRTAAHTYRHLPDASHYIQNPSVWKACQGDSLRLSEVSSRLADLIEDAGKVYVA